MSKSKIFRIYKDRENASNRHVLDEVENDKNKKVFNIILTYSYSYVYHKFKLFARIVDGNRVILNDIIREIATFSHIEIKNHVISYYMKEFNQKNTPEKVFVFLGLYPLKDNFLVPLPENDTMYINFRPNIKKNDQLRLELYEEEAEIQEENKKKIYYINEKSKRAKERKIGYIIKKVYLWRKLYNGIQDKNGKGIKMTLQDAAEKVEISKKSLDEYLNQIKLGRDYGFDFNKHRNDKVGVLRGFVKSQQPQTASQKIRRKNRNKITPQNEPKTLNKLEADDISQSMIPRDSQASLNIFCPSNSMG